MPLHFKLRVFIPAASFAFNYVLPPPQEHIHICMTYFLISGICSNATFWLRLFVITLFKCAVQDLELCWKHSECWINIRNKWKNMCMFGGNQLNWSEQNTNHDMIWHSSSKYKLFLVIFLYSLSFFNLILFKDTWTCLLHEILHTSRNWASRVPVTQIVKLVPNRLFFNPHPFTCSLHPQCLSIYMFMHIHCLSTTYK